MPLHIDLDYSRNPSLLKLALYCKGLRIPEQTWQLLEQGRGIMRTRAGLGSGLELILPGNYWTNVPVSESFCATSPFSLVNEGEALLISHPDCKPVPVGLAPRPDWYGQHCSSGKPMVQVGTLQGTYLGIFPTRVCDFWHSAEQCRFCSLGLNLGADDAQQKTLGEVLDTVIAAQEQSGITYVDFNTGHYDDHSYLDALEPLIAAVKRRTGLLVGIQTPPHPDLSRYRRLRDMGVNRVSFCFEIFDPQLFAEICPGKHREYGLDGYLRTMDYCAGLGKSASLWEPFVTNGEIIAGLEPPESTMAAISRIVAVGAIPTVCVFRPLKGTAFASKPAPNLEDMIPVFRHLYESCMQAKLPIGLAPGIHVSLVMLPEECAGLSPRSRGLRFRLQGTTTRIKGKLFALALHRKMNRAQAAAPR